MQQPTCTPPLSRVAAGIVVASALELAGHWAPWPRRLPRLLAYGYGVSAILAGAAIALDRRTWRRLAAICAAAGSAVAASYVLDHALNQWAKASAGHDRNR